MDVVLEPGGMGQFDVLVDDEVVASRGGTVKKVLFVRVDRATFPTPDEIVRAVQARLG